MSSSDSPSRRFCVCLGTLVLAWGIQAIVAQSLLVREALVLMFGSELTWGLVLFFVGIPLGFFLIGNVVGLVGILWQRADNRKRLAALRGTSG